MVDKGGDVKVRGVILCWEHRSTDKATIVEITPDLTSLTESCMCGPRQRRRQGAITHEDSDVAHDDDEHATDSELIWAAVDNVHTIDADANSSDHDIVCDVTVHADEREERATATAYLQDDAHENALIHRLDAASISSDHDLLDVALNLALADDFFYDDDEPPTPPPLPPPLYPESHVEAVATRWVDGIHCAANAIQLVNSPRCQTLGNRQLSLVACCQDDAQCTSYVWWDDCGSWIGRRTRVEGAARYVVFKPKREAKSLADDISNGSMHILVANTTVHMTRASGANRSRMIPDIMFVQCLHEALFDIDAAQDMHSGSECVICSTCAPRACEPVRYCPVCQLRSHDECIAELLEPMRARVSEVLSTGTASAILEYTPVKERIELERRGELVGGLLFVCQWCYDLFACAAEGV